MADSPFKGLTVLGVSAKATQSAEKVVEAGDIIREKVNIAALREKDAISRQIAAKGIVKHENLLKMSPTELYHLRQEIDALLPAVKLTDMNLEEELVIQYQLAKTLQKSVMENDSKGTPDKEKSQLLKNATATLQSLINLQSTVYTSERLKFVESCMRNAFEGVSLDIRTKFFESYEKLLKDSQK